MHRFSAMLCKDGARLSATAAVGMILIAMVAQVTLKDVAAQESHLVIAIGMATTEFSAGEPILVQVEITNHWSQMVGVPGMHMPPEETGVTVYDSSGARVESHIEKLEKQDGSHLAGSRFARFIQPGATYSVKISLRRWFDLNQPGRYKIVITQKDPVSGASVSSNAVTFTIK